MSFVVSSELNCRHPADARRSLCKRCYHDRECTDLLALDRSAMKGCDQPPLRIPRIFINIGAVLAFGHSGLVMDYKVVAFQEHPVRQNRLWELDYRRFVPGHERLLVLSHCDAGYYRCSQ